MCNIAGYIGNRQAAPILIEMLRRQEWLDAGLGAGIATIHEGKIYHAKITGTVDDLVRETDALSFPGTIGFIHSRPDGKPFSYLHPFVTENGKIALVHNGNCCVDEKSVKSRNAVADFLADRGVKFKSVYRYERSGYPKLKNGDYVAYGETLAEYINYLKEKTGDSYEKVMADAKSEMFSDMVSVMLTTDHPDRIFVTRISRPMNVMISGNETYIASSQLGFPEVERVDYMGSLPQMRSSVVKKGGFEVTPYKVVGGQVTDYTTAEFMGAYERTKAALAERTINIDDLGPYLFTDKRSLMCDQLRPRAKLMYDVLYELSKSGTLTMTTEERELPWLAGTGQSAVKRFSFSYKEKEA